MQDPLNHDQILSVAAEVVAVVLKHTRRFVEAKNILRAALAAFAGGVKDDSFPPAA